MTYDLLDDNARMDEYLERAMRRGTQIRRRRILSQVTIALVALCALVIPIGVLTSGTPPSNGSAGSPAFQLVRWSHVSYPGLNVSDATYPAQMGCGPGFPAEFPVDVQQVTYVGPNGPGHTLALVLVKCDSGTPTPSSFYLFAPGRSAAQPRLLQIVLGPPKPRVDVIWYAQHFTVSGNTVSLHAKGVTQNDAVCCPSISKTFHWTINGSRLIAH